MSCHDPKNVKTMAAPVISAPAPMTNQSRTRCSCARPRSAQAVQRASKSASGALVDDARYVPPNGRGIGALATTQLCGDLVADAVQSGTSVRKNGAVGSSPDDTLEFWFSGEDDADISDAIETDSTTVRDEHPDRVRRRGSRTAAGAALRPRSRG